MPGTILYQDGMVYWDDVTSSENIIHAVDVKKKTELVAFANRGEGPNDFTAETLSLCPDGGIFLNDSNKPLEILYQVNRSDGSVVFTSNKYEHHSGATSLLHLNDGSTLFLCPRLDKLFLTTDGHAFGERPIKDEMNNAYDVFQGQIAYHSERKVLVYCNLVFPYLSVYKHSGNGNWSLSKELKGDWDYTVNEGTLRFAPDSKKGAMELALTDDYIVLLQRDTEVEGVLSNKEKRGRNMASLPHSLFVYDYDLKLKKIINMPFPMLRLCGDADTNTVYAMSVNPEFELISIDLEE